MTAKTYSTSPMPSREASAGLPLLTALRLGLTVRRQRATLRKLDDAALHDLGLSRAQAEAEAARPVWDVPDRWRR